MLYWSLVFIVYSFIGWLWETIYCSIKMKKFEYRGFLLGPYCPVYGFGILSVLLLVPDNSGSLINMYFNIIVIVTIIEYITSFLLEKLFHMELWDYSNIPLNIEGRVDVFVSLFWGIGGLFLIKIVQPFIDFQVNKMLYEINKGFLLLLVIIFLVDVLLTLLFTISVKPQIKNIVDTTDPENSSFKEYRLKNLFRHEGSHQYRLKLLKHLKEEPKSLGIKNLNRVISNYPDFKIK